MSDYAPITYMSSIGPRVGVAYIDGIFLEWIDSGIRVTDLGRVVGYAMVEPSDYPHLKLQELLDRENSGSGMARGSTGELYRIVLSTPANNDGKIAEATYDFEVARSHVYVP